MSIFSILIFLLVGTIAGAIADRLTGAANKDWISTVLLGIGGAIVGNFLGKLLGIYTGFLTLSVGSILSAVVGAYVLTWVVRKLR